jgi:hypothetical protein
VIQSIPGDHDLLVRIDEQVKALRSDFMAERSAAVSRGEGHDRELKDIRRDVESLRMSRVQLYAIAATLSAIISVVMKVFWR